MCIRDRERGVAASIVEDLGRGRRGFAGVLCILIAATLLNGVLLKAELRDEELGSYYAVFYAGPERPSLAKWEEIVEEVWRRACRRE